MNKLISSIVRHHTPCYFISPHLDDAVLSAGCLMRYLVQRGVPVTVINVFTKGGSGPQTWSARQAVRSSGYAGSASLYAARKLEDQQALTRLGAQIINLDYTDAPWRRCPAPGPVARLLEPLLPEATHIYPTYRLHVASGRVSVWDSSLAANLSADLVRLVPQNAVVFCPQAIGGHVDHCLVKTAVEACFTPVYWLDQPYSLKQPAPARGYSFPIRPSYKKSLLRQYKTQIGLLFPSGKIPLLEEKFLGAKL